MIAEIASQVNLKIHFSMCENVCPHFKKRQISLSSDYKKNNKRAFLFLCFPSVRKQEDPAMIGSMWCAFAFHCYREQNFPLLKWNSLRRVENCDLMVQKSKSLFQDGQRRGYVASILTERGACAQEKQSRFSYLSGSKWTWIQPRGGPNRKPHLHRCHKSNG